MLPIRDNIRSRSYPYVTITLIAINVAVFIYQVTLKEPEATKSVFQYGFMPLRVLAAIQKVGALHLEKAFYVQTRYGLVPYTLKLELSTQPLAVVATLFTSMFMHGGWLHILMNMWYLWIFGDNVEDRLGHVPYLLVYLVCGVCAAALQTIWQMDSRVPMVGASGAIAGVLGAYLIAFPWARVLTILPIFIFWQFIEVPAFIILGLWFVGQFFSGAASITHADSGGVAYWAHVGGFGAGLLIMLAVRRVERWRQRSRPVEVILPGERRGPRL